MTTTGKGPCRNYEPDFKLYGRELEAGHSGPHRDHRGNEWEETLPPEPWRCDANWHPGRAVAAVPPSAPAMTGCTVIGTATSGASRKGQEGPGRRADNRAGGGSPGRDQLRPLHHPTQQFKRTRKQIGWRSVWTATQSVCPIRFLPGQDVL